MSSSWGPIPRLSETFTPPMTVGEAGLGKAPFDREGFNLLAEKLLAHLSTTPHDMGLLLDLSVALQLAARREDGLIAQREALSRQQVYRICGSEGPPPEPCIRMLAICAPGDLMTNTPLEFIVDHIPVRLDLLFVVPGRPLPPEVPDHDIAFVAVSQSEEREPLLDSLSQLSAAWPRPTMQDPIRLRETSREGVWRALRDVKGIAMPPVVRAARSAIEKLFSGKITLGDLYEGLHFPVLLRPIDSHAGRELEKIVESSSLERYLAQSAEPEYYVTQFVDYAAADGLYRKYRIVLIEGKPFLCHLGIYEKWMVHYAHAGMTENAEKRAEEQRAMEQFDEGFARRHAAAFRQIYERIGLEYLGIDCSETPGGELLVFEADAAMVIHAMDPPALFPYKQVQMRKVFDAFYAMVERACRREAPSA